VDDEVYKLVLFVVTKGKRATMKYSTTVAVLYFNNMNCVRTSMGREGKGRLLNCKCNWTVGQGRGKNIQFLAFCADTEMDLEISRSRVGA